ncbi:MAG: preprotein translocase subunit YajC [Bacteroidota bacterium]|nr:preprotein translocase subunit YajC [Bacteroidota bacterium]
MYTTSILQAAPGGAGSMVPFLLVMVVFFVFMILPQMRRQKKTKSFIADLRKGDHIVTTGGVHAKISQIQDTYLVLDLEEGKMKVDKSGVSMESTQAAYPSATAKK